MMNKKYFFVLLFLCAIVLFPSCGDTTTNTAIDEEWKALNDQRFNDIANNTTYSERASESGNGSVYYKSTDVLKSLKITDAKTPEFTDSVVVRYKGWYLDTDNKKIVFDSTEDDNNAQTGIGFRLGTVIDGWTTMLQGMRVGEEVEACIPYPLAYGTAGNNVIPGYTTLWFNIKLLKIVDIAERE